MALTQTNMVANVHHSEVLFHACSSQINGIFREPGLCMVSFISNFAEEIFDILNLAILPSTKMEDTYSYCSGHILIRVIGLKEKKHRKKTED